MRVARARPSYAHRVKPPQREVRPLDLPMTPFAVGGLALWLAALLVVLPFQDTLEADGRGRWIWICLSGVAIGVPGVVHMMRHDRHRRRRRAGSGGEE